ncbi:MAG: hypothetical protein QOF30_1101 [Acidimicrobiaceae bacterium]|nr:hypothetical protein [Acidimicrobiaceae bacterium]
MEQWDRGALDLVAPAFIEFRTDRTGSFGFIAVAGWMDYRNAERGVPASSSPGREPTREIR